MKLPTRWPHRILYLAVIVLFFGWLYWAGSGRTQRLDTFQRRVLVRLQRLQPDLEYTVRSGGVILAHGEGRFHPIDLRKTWAEYQRGDLDIDPAAKRLAEELSTAAERQASVPGWPEVAERLYALPLTLDSVHPALVRSDAAKWLAVRRGPSGLPLYLVYQPSDSEAPIVLTRPMTDQWEGAPSIDGLLEIALENAGGIGASLESTDSAEGKPPLPLRTADAPALAIAGRADAGNFLLEMLRQEMPAAEIDAFALAFRDWRTLAVWPGDPPPDADWYLHFLGVESDDPRIMVRTEGLPAAMLAP